MSEEQNLISKGLPISYIDWDEGTTTLFHFYECEFLQDFGKFKKGEKYENISVDFDNCFVEAYEEIKGNSNPKITNQKFKMIPID